ncbi:MAG: site-2 protease family protein [Oscillospiraceae bacterium]|nr:site-2 protease family protein [Oscillospiraceae bacterium]
MSTIQTIWNGLDWSFLTNMLLSVVPALICITLHELAHGVVAYWLGDTTAKDAGRLTLNPIKHLDLMGLVMMVVFHFGWAKPVPVNMSRFENPRRGMAVTAVAGPLMNVLITIVFLFLYGLLYKPLNGEGFVLEMIALTASISLSFAIFNILPISPLDGSKVLGAVLPDRQYALLMRYERYGMLLLLALVATGVLGRPLSAITQTAFDKLFIFAEWGYELIG